MGLPSRILVQNSKKKLFYEQVTEFFNQGTRERSVPTEHFFNVLTELVLFRSDRTFLLKIQEHWNIF